MSCNTVELDYLLVGCESIYTLCPRPEGGFALLQIFGMVIVREHARQDVVCDFVANERLKAKVGKPRYKRSTQVMYVAVRYVRQLPTLEHQLQSIVDAPSVDRLALSQWRGKYVTFLPGKRLELCQDGRGLWRNVNQMRSALLSPAGRDLPQTCIQIKFAPLCIRHLTLPLPRENH